MMVINGPAQKLNRVDWSEALYMSSSSAPGITTVNLSAIPYFANANRQPTEMRVWLAASLLKAEPLAPSSLACDAVPSASHCWTSDTVFALNDLVEPSASDDTTIPRFTWWDHRGTKEWVDYKFDRSQKVSSVDVYWWDERRLKAHCRVPQTWRLLYQDGGEWKSISGAEEFGTKMDQFNRVTFPSVRATALRIEAQLQGGWSGGILEWRVH